MTDATEYFQTASRNAYANSGRIGWILVQVAAAYAWKLRESDPDLTVPGTLRHAMKSYDEQTRQAWINTTADFMADAYDNAGAPLSAEWLATHLNNSFPSSVRWEK